jgi:hypothetical protein
MRRLRVILPAVTVAAGLWAQTANKPLTNAEIESMLAAGVPESTIVMEIQAAVFGGFAALDASSTAVIALKQKGASEVVLDAVVWAEPLDARTKQQQGLDRAAPGLPNSAGVYNRGPSEWVRLRSFLVWPVFSSKWNLSLRRSHAYNVPVSGSHAEVQIRERQPAFYLRELASDGWQIIRLGLGGDRRFVQLVSSGEFPFRDRFASSGKVQIIRIAGDVFKLQPVAPLEPGEYALCSAVPSGPNSSVCYGFGVRR